MKAKKWIAWLCAIAAFVPLVLAGGGMQTSAAAVETTTNTPDTYYYDLADGAYLVTGGGQDPTAADTSLTVNGAAFTSGNTLSTPGDYTIVNKYTDRNNKKVELTQQVVLYKRGDTHPDGKYDVKDLVAMKKHEQGIELDSKAGTMAVDAYLGEPAASIIRDYLLSKDITDLEAALPKADALTFNGGSKNVMPIGGYMGPADKTGTELSSKYTDVVYNYLTDYYYDLVKDAGINLILTAPHTNGTESVIQKELELAEKYDMRVFVGPSYLFSSEAEGGGVTQTNLEQLLREYSGYSSMAGFTLQDEPADGTYPNTVSSATWGKSPDLAKMLSKYANLTGFTNLFPWWTEYGDETAYRNYLNKYFELYGEGADHLSFDYYVFPEDDDSTWNKAQYFNNLRVVKEVADAHDVPFWSTIQAGNYVSGEAQFSFFGGDTKYVTEAMTLWNVNTSLAYGAKGITYYPLIQPYDYAAKGYTIGSTTYITGVNYERNGIIGADGNTTPYYTYIQKANQQIAAVDEVLMNATHKGFIATGTAATDTGFSGSSNTPLSSVSSNQTAGVFVGCFDYYGKNAYYVVNYDLNNSANITLTFDQDYALGVTVDGKFSSRSTNSKAYALTLTAGNAALVVVGDTNATQITNAENLINAIPADPSEAGYYEAVVAARTAYNGLTKAEKGQISDEALNTLTFHDEKTRSYENVKAMINDLPESFSLAVIESIDKTNAAYSALGDWSVLITSAEKAKLEGLVTDRLAVSVLINAATGRLIDQVGVISSTVGTADDAQYGKVFTMNFAADATAAEQAGFRLYGDLSGYTGRHFYIYNPTDADVRAWMYSDAGALNVNGTSANLLTMKPGWNKVELDDSASITQFFQGAFIEKAISGGTWKITSVYSITDAAQAELAAIPVNALIADLPTDTAVITAENYTEYETKVNNIKTAYHALSALAKTYVTGMEKVTACEDRIAAIKTELGAVGEVNTLLNALPSASVVAVKDLADVQAAKAAYDALALELQAQVDAELKANLDDCVTALDGFSLLINAKADRYDDPYGVTTAVGRETDETYGPVVTITYDTAATTGFALYGNITGYENRYFYVHNPTSERKGAWMYYVGENGQQQLPVTTGENPSLLWLEPGWNKVELPDDVAITQSIIAEIGGMTGTWKITSVYAATDAALVGQEVKDVELLIAALPDASALKISDKENVNAAKAAYDALGDNTTQVTNATKLTECLAKVAQWDELDNKTVLSVSDSTDGVVDADGSIVDNNTYGQVISIPNGRDMIVVKPNATNAAYKASKGIEFYVYNPTESALTFTTQDGGTGAAWSSFGSFTAEKGWTKFQVLEQADANDKNIIADGMELYFFGTMNGDGWLVTSVYAMTEDDVNAAKAAKVDALIEALPAVNDVKIENKDQIVAARAAYDALTEAQKDLVKDLAKLTACEAKIAELETPADNVTPVNEAIAALKEATALTVADKQAVKDAKAAYDALTEAEQAQVENVTKLNNCVAKVNFWEKLDGKTVLSATNAAITSAGAGWAAIDNDVDDNTFGKVMTFGDTTALAIEAGSGRTANYKTSKAIGFYIYNPTNQVVNGNISDQLEFQLKPNSWNYIEYFDYDANQKKVFINTDATFYINAAFTGEGWRISSFYSQDAGAVDVEGATIVKDASLDYVLGSDYTITTKIDHDEFGKVMSIVEDDTMSDRYFAIDSRDATFKASNNIVFYVYNPTNAIVNGYYTIDWAEANNVYFQLESGWNRIYLADVGDANGQKFITSDSVVYFYANMAGEGWLISSFYSLPDPTAVGTAVPETPVDPEAEAAAAVDALIAQFPTVTEITDTHRDEIAAAKAEYDKLSDGAKAKLADEQKLLDCVDKVAAWDAYIEKRHKDEWGNKVVLSNGDNSIIESNVEDNEFGIASTIVRENTAKNACLLISSGNLADAVEFYVYNPTDQDVTSAYFVIDSDWGISKYVTLAKNSWTCVHVEWAELVSTKGSMWFYAPMDAAADGTKWRFSDVYTAEVQNSGANEIEAVNDLIAALPGAAQLTAANKQDVTNAKLAYDALTPEQQEQVTADVANLNLCDAKVTYWDNLTTSKVYNQTNFICNTLANGTGVESNPTAVEDRIFGTVGRISGNQGVVILSHNNRGAAWSTSESVGFYIYNPTGANVTINYCYNWIDDYNVSVTAEAGKWTYIELKDHEGNDNKQFISSGSQIYFYANFTDGWLISDCYSAPIPQMPMEMLVNPATQTIVPWNGTANEGATITKTTDATYGNVFAITLTDATNLAAGKLSLDSPITFAGYDSIEFYVYNPEDREVQLSMNYGAAWEHTETVLLKGLQWTRVVVPTNGYTGTNEAIAIKGSANVEYKMSAIYGWKAS